jgi:hypothetical protein
LTSTYNQINVPTCKDELLFQSQWPQLQLRYGYLIYHVCDIIAKSDTTATDANASISLLYVNTVDFAAPVNASNPALMEMHRDCSTAMNASNPAAARIGVSILQHMCL